MNWLRLAPYAALVLLGGVAVWFVMDLRATMVAQGTVIDGLTRSNAALVTQSAQSAMARDVDAARATLEMQRARDATAAVESVLTAELGECADAPLDPAITIILNGLFSRND